MSSLTHLRMLWSINLTLIFKVKHLLFCICKKRAITVDVSWRFASTHTAPAVELFVQFVLNLKVLHYIKIPASVTINLLIRCNFFATRFCLRQNFHNSWRYITVHIKQEPLQRGNESHFWTQIETAELYHYMSWTTNNYQVKSIIYIYNIYIYIYIYYIYIYIPCTEKRPL